MNITEVLRKIQHGDRQAFALIVKQYEHPLFGFLGRMGLPQALAEDVAQETFLRAWRELFQYDASRGAFSTWLYTIAKNLALNELARSSSRNEIAAGEDSLEPVCEQPQPGEALAIAQRKHRLHRALRQLSLPDRSVIALAYVAELDMNDIARIEGCTTGAVKTRLHRARNRLHQLLENDDA